MEAIPMRNRFNTFFIVVVGFMILTIPTWAHHGNASYETGKVVTVKGNVTEWFWANPHCLLKFDEKADNGQVNHWIGETQAPANMIDAGWNKNSFKPGDQVTVDIRPAKSGNFAGIISRVVFADGKVLSTERSNGVGADLYKK
jgi:Family of unknown function (DUF6152)